MNIFYENRRDEMDLLHVNRSREHTYPSHFHQSIELFILKRGNYVLTINGNEYEMGNGSVAFIDSYDIHSYERISADADDCVIIIPYKLSLRFNEMRENRRPESCVLNSSCLAERVLSVVDSFIQPETDACIRSSAAELVLSILFASLQFGDTRDKSESCLVRKILSYIQENYREDISRKSISKALGYTPEHISRIFHKYVKRSLKDYINALRLEFIEQHRSREGGVSVTELVYLSGFGSEGSYYRAKRKQTSTCKTKKV